MEFKAEKAVIDNGVKIIFVVIEGLNNFGSSSEWNEYREKKLGELYKRYEGINVHEDTILEGFNILHDRTGVKRRKNIPASENLIKLLLKNHGMPYINKVVDIYNLISLDSKLALGAHNMDKVVGDVTLRFTDGTEKYIPLGQNDPVPVNPHEYCYCDDSNEVLCRLEIRQVNKTKVDESAKNIFYIVEGNDAATDELLQKTALEIIDTTTKYCGGMGRVVIPQII